MKIYIILYPDCEEPTIIKERQIAYHLCKDFNGEGSITASEFDYDTWKVTLLCASSDGEYQEFVKQ